MFYLTEHIKSKNQKRKLIAGLKKEFQYNCFLIDSWIEETDRVLRKVAAADHEIFVVYTLMDFQRLFTELCFREGILYDALDPKEIAHFNAILRHFSSADVTNWLNNSIKQWEDSQLEAAEVNRLFEFERGQMKGYKDQLNNMLKSMK